MKNRLNDFFAAFKKYDWKKIGGLWAKLDCLLSRMVFGSAVEEYVALEFYRKNFRERNRFLTGHRQAVINKRFLKKTTKEQRDRIGNKLQFNRFFNEFVHRDYLDSAHASEAEISAFIQKHGVILSKPLSSTHGDGIIKIDRAEITPSMLSMLGSGKYLLEEVIVQHPEIAKINPSSVNTVRVATALDRKGHAHIIGACLRCGAKGSIVDNTHSGGAAYPIHTDYGIVIGAGKNRKTFEEFIVHPGSDTVMPGLRIPNWSVLVDCVTRAAEKIPELPYLGWDIAITKDGIEFIEGNYGHSAVGIQSDQVGKFRKVNEILYGKA